MAVVETAPALVETSATDKLAAPSAEGETPTGGLSAIKKRIGDAATNIYDKVKGGEYSVADAAAVIEFNDGKPTLNPSEALARIDSATGGNMGGVVGTPGNFRDESVNLLVRISGDKELNKMYDTAGTVLNIRKGVDTASVASVMTGIQSLVGISPLKEYIDSSAELAVAVKYLNLAIGLGIPDAIDALRQKFANDRYLREQLIESVRGVILRSDLPTLNKIIDWVGADGVAQRVDNPVKLLLMSYRLPYETPSSDYPSKYTELTNTLNALDPQWQVEVLSGTSVNTLSPFEFVSSDADLILSSHDDRFDVVLALGPEYRTEDLFELKRRYYPTIINWSSPNALLQ